MVQRRPYDLSIVPKRNGRSASIIIKKNKRADGKLSEVFAVKLFMKMFPEVNVTNIALLIHSVTIVATTGGCCRPKANSFAYFLAPGPKHAGISTGSVTRVQLSQQQPRQHA